MDWFHEKHNTDEWHGGQRVITGEQARAAGGG